jgi:colicin import membrane protein
MDITKELQQFNITDAAIAELDSRCRKLTVKDVNDTAGYEIVKKARIDIKKRRVEVEKTRVSLKAESLEYGRKVDGEAKRIFALLEPIEKHLIAQENIVDDERERIKKEAEEKEAARIQARTEKLVSLGMSYNGIIYSFNGISLSHDLMMKATDEQMEAFYIRVESAAEAKRKEEEEKRLALEAEQKRIAEIEKEQKRIAAEQAEKERALKAESDRIEAEKKAAEDAKRKVEAERIRAQELENARAEAAEKAKKEESARIEREAKEKAQKEAKAEAERKRKEARAPDKEKIGIFLDAVACVTIPKMKTEEGNELLDFAIKGISQIVAQAHERMNKL